MKDLDQQQAEFVTELAHDYGVHHANVIQLKQELVRVSKERDAALEQFAALRKRHEAQAQDLADIQDQMRGRALPRARKPVGK